MSSAVTLSDLWTGLEVVGVFAFYVICVFVVVMVAAVLIMPWDRWH